MQKHFMIAVGFAAALMSSTAIAQTLNESGDTTLPQLLVTASRTPVEQKKTGRAYTVVTGEQLEKSQARYVADALRQVPGVHVSRTGSFGGLTQLRLRGAEGNHVLVMIDGVEVSSVGQGEYDFSGLVAGNIERIEVLRGPQSAFWGSSATAGVINIITKSGARNSAHADMQTEVGGDGTALGMFAARGGSERFDAAFSLIHRQTDGFNISDFGDEKDGDKNLTGLARFTLDVSDNLRLDASGRAVNRHSDSDAQDFAFPATATQGLVIDTDNQRRAQEFSGTIGATWRSLDDTWTHVARLSGSSDRNEYWKQGRRTSGNRGQRTKLSFQSTYQFETPNWADATHQLTAGVEWERERFRQIPPIFNASQLITQQRVTKSFVAEYRGEFADQFYLNAALRHDLNDRFADATTYSVAAAWAIPNTGTRLHASVGTGVTNPTFFEQFGFVPARFKGNPGLVPEKSFGWDIGIEQTLLNGDLVIDVTYFDQDLTDEIGTVSPPPTFISSPINKQGTSLRKGVEVSATAHLFEGFTATASYTYTDATEFPGVVEVRRPQHSASLNAAYRFFDGRARIFGEIIYNGEMEDLEFITATPQTRVTLDDYVLVNAGGSFRFNDHLEAYARVENLFDEEYEEIYGFNTQGRTGFVGLKASF